MMYGDSLTQQSSGDRTWRCRVWRHLTGLGVPVDMVGPRHDLWNWRLNRAGSTQYSGSGCDTDHASEWGMQFRSPVYDVSDMVRDYHPDVLVGLIGLNDLLYGLLSPEQLTERWRSEITASRAIAPSTDFVLVPIPDTWYNQVDDYNARLGALAAELDSVDSRVVVSASAGLVPATDTIDNSHPSANGEERIAATVSDSLAVLGLGRAWPRPLVTRAPGPEMAPVPRVVASEGRVAASWTRPDYANAERVWMRDVTTAPAVGQTFGRSSGHHVVGQGRRRAHVLRAAAAGQGLAGVGHEVDARQRPRPGETPRGHLPTGRPATRLSGERLVARRDLRHQLRRRAARRDRSRALEGGRQADGTDAEVRHLPPRPAPRLRAEGALLRSAGGRLLRNWPVPVVPLTRLRDVIRASAVLVLVCGLLGLPALAASEAAAPPAHTLTVGGSGVGLYPAFAADVERYGVTTTSATAGSGERLRDHRRPAGRRARRRQAGGRRTGNRDRTHCW